MNSINKVFEKFEKKFQFGDNKTFIMLTSEWGQLKQEIQEIHYKEIQKLISDNDYVEELNNGLGFQIDNLQEENHQLKKEIERLNKEVSDVHIAWKSYFDSSKKFEKENKNLKIIIEGLKSKRN